MPVIPFDSPMNHLNNTPPHIDYESHWLLLAIQSDFIRFRSGEQDNQRAIELRKITTRLSSALARFEPPKGAA
ncbi:hypothetical protein [Pseudomonas sp. TMP25]|uniref:hypothetical protein n=1 Tax=Pseudomonas sp. TMP25 TaxID=3136561 RepID=UPI00310166C4